MSQGPYLLRYVAWHDYNGETRLDQTINVCTEGSACILDLEKFFLTYSGLQGDSLVHFFLFFLWVLTSFKLLSQLKIAISSVLHSTFQLC